MTRWVGGRPGNVGAAGAGRRLDGGGDARGPQEVDLDGGVEGGVEGDGGGRVDDDVARGQDLPALVVEAEPVPAHVTGHRHQAAFDLVGEAVAPLGSEPVEAVVADDLPCRSAPTPTGAGWAGRGRRPRSRARERRSRSTTAVPRKPVAPVTRIRVPARAGMEWISGGWLGRAGPVAARRCAPRAPISVYHMVDGCR